MTKIIISLLVIALLVGAYFFFRRTAAPSQHTLYIIEWSKNPQAHPDWVIKTGERCGNAPFIYPTDGLIGYLWGDSWRPGQKHQGIDIFSQSEPGQTPVVAAYDGYLTRMADWKSSIIIRIPKDPLQPNRQIWLYYTHMADKDGNSFILPDYPPGSSEIYVKAGTLLGYQGDYSGDPSDPVWVHLHASIVLDNGNGNFRNELDIQNTLDPSPYWGLNLNNDKYNGEIPTCQSD